MSAPQRLGLRGVWVDAQGQGLPPSHPTRPDLILRAFTEILDVAIESDDGAGS